jgi:Cys-rich protein (TIGR04453 family)
MKLKMIQTATLVSLLFSIHCKNKVAEQCKEICTFSLKCIQENQTNSIYSSKDKESFEIQCFNSCTMLQSEFIVCYEKHQNSCSEYYSCLLNSDIFE